MATESFEMETGVPFVKWIERHVELDLRHQPLEMYIRRMSFYIPLAFAGVGLLTAGLGLAILLSSAKGASPEGAGAKAMEEIGFLGSIPVQKGLGFLVVGLTSCVGFGWVAFRQGRSFWRARNFQLTLRDGSFYLSYAGHAEIFEADDVTQACVVRPGTVGATEGALGFANGRMLTLDSCLTDLHALGVVMDLRFRSEFPPSLEDLARERREKLRKIRGLS